MNSRRSWMRSDHSQQKRWDRSVNITGSAWPIPVTHWKATHWRNPKRKLWLKTAWPCKGNRFTMSMKRLVTRMPTIIYNWWQQTNSWRLPIFWNFMNFSISALIHRRQVSSEPSRYSSVEVTIRYHLRKRFLSWLTSSLRGIDSMSSCCILSNWQHWRIRNLSLSIRL